MNKKLKNERIPRRILNQISQSRERAEESEGFTRKELSGSSLLDSIENPFGNTIEENYYQFDDALISQEIKRRRKLEKLSEVSLGELAGVSRSTIQKIEAGNMNISLDSIIKVLKAVGMELFWK